MNSDFSELMRDCIDGKLDDDFDIEEGGHTLKAIYQTLYQNRLC